MLDKQFFGGLAGGRLLATYSSSVAVTPVKVIFKNLDSDSIELSNSFEDEIWEKLSRRWNREQRLCHKGSIDWMRAETLKYDWIDL